MPPRRQRAAAQAAAANLRTPTPQVVEEPSDDEMPDAAPTPASDAADSPAPEEDDAASPPPNSEPPSEAASPAPVQSLPPRRRRLGRPPKNKPPGWDLIDPNEGSDAGTPKKRRGRPPGTGPGRWPKNRHEVPQTTQLVIDKEGNTVDVVDDEAVLPDIPEGETKVDKNGVLQGGREYRCRTFTLKGKGDKLYMLSTEPARCIGFRDSYLFFQKHPVLYKYVIDDAIKRDMIDRNLMPHSYKGRTIGVVTARSVFREFGAQIVIGGKKVMDDYDEQRAKENGDVEGELAVPTDVLPKEGEEYNKNQYVAWHGASAVYHTSGPSLPLQNGKVPDPKKRKVVITDANWMLEHARACSQYNSTLTERRRAAFNGVYDIYTNVTHYLAHTQPTRAKWEREPEATAKYQAEVTGLSNGHSEGPTDLTMEGGMEVDDAVRDYPVTNSTNGTTTDGPTMNGTTINSHQTQAKSTLFTPVEPIYSRNYAIIDTYAQNPPPGVVTSAGPSHSRNPFHSTSILDISPELMAMLPADCLKSLQEEQAKLRAYQESFGSEATDGLRAYIRPGGLN